PLAAVATGSGVSATSAVVRITVVNPVNIALTTPAINGGQFSFDYSANPGLTYVVQNTSDFRQWSQGVTNRAASNPVHFAEPVISDSWRFYRVLRLPNP